MPLEISHDHIALRVVDYDGTVAWYREKLDFEVDQEWPFGDMRLAYMHNGSAKIEILGGSTAEPKNRSTHLSPRSNTRVSTTSAYASTTLT
jgi:Glyoxalase/Bleomycin resistance protein/Dioxygenase superfamily.